MEHSLLSDPGETRPVVARWTITADLVLESATHLGGEVNASSMMLLRDACQGGALLPGTSVAGALRSHLADVLGGYRVEEDPRVAQLLGGSRGDEGGSQSPLVVFDSLGELPAKRMIEIRDGVQIEAARGIADEHKKFDLEVLPAGTRFPLRFDLVVPAASEEDKLVSLLVAALSGLSGEISIGARRSRGLGAARAERWQAVRYDLSSPDGWMSWILSDAETPAERGKGLNDVHTACLRELPKLALQALDDQRRRVVIEVELASKGPLLVRNAPAEPDAPDAVHLRSGGRSVLPGTSVAGVLRARAMRIARIVRSGKEDAEQRVDAIFGPRLDGIPGRNEFRACASRLRIAESVVDGSARRRPSRIRIDRFTQGVASGALFEEEVEFGGRVRLRLELRNPQDGEVGLLLLVLKDLLSGDLPIGGTSSVGRGVFEGTATLWMEAGIKICVEPDLSPDPVIDHEIQKLWNAASIGGIS
ncbi:MAG: hypothetical protein KF773_10690 [Deltaproteobacteria bacterium]|nr:hypothetical protein [Deltaproteobacteria bacterium]